MNFLDLNKDGVVDLSEFKRWYFTGMKPYNGSRRTMLKFGVKSMAIVDVAKEEAKNILLSQELKTKSSKFSIGLNVPKNPQTSVSASVMLGGEESTKINNELRSKYGNEEGSPNDVFVELRFSVTAGTAEKHSNALQKVHDDIMKIS